MILQPLDGVKAYTDEKIVVLQKFNDVDVQQGSVGDNTESINPKDVTPMSEIFNTPTVVNALSSTGGLIVHSALSMIENAGLSSYRTQYGDASFVAGGHISSIRSSSNYDYDDVGELAVDAIIKNEQKDFV